MVQALIGLWDICIPTPQKNAQKLRPPLSPSFFCSKWGLIAYLSLAGEHVPAVPWGDAGGPAHGGGGGGGPFGGGPRRVRGLRAGAHRRRPPPTNGPQPDPGVCACVCVYVMIGIN